LFRRRLNILLCAYLLAGAVLIGRLAQIQIHWHEGFDESSYARAGGSRILETVRGGIYTRWGMPLAMSVPSFDLAVHYGPLLLASSAPWQHPRVRQLMDEFLGRDGPSGYGDEYSWDSYARPRRAGTPPSAPPAEAAGKDRYEYLWSVRQVRSRHYGSMEGYVCRRLMGESRRAIASSPPGQAGPEGWRQAVAGLTGVAPDELTADADRTVQRVSRMQGAVQEASGKDAQRDYVRVVEEDQFHPVVKDVPQEVAALVRSRPESFPGVRVVERSRRRYPNGDLAPHVVGYLSAISPEAWERIVADGRAWTAAMPVTKAADRYRMDDQAGVSGIENAYEGLLRGRRGCVEEFRVFKVLKVEKRSVQTAPEPGCGVYLTLRDDLQRAANQALACAAQTPALEFRSGALVIVDVRDGAVLAAATYPSFDLGTYGRDYDRLEADERRPQFFRPLQAALPIGSTYKPFVAIAALEEHAITPATTFTCQGGQRFSSGGTSRQFDCTAVHGTRTLIPAIEVSCNVYFYNVALRAGGEALTRWGRLFGLGVPTGVDLPFERAGQIPEAGSTFATLNLGIGQGDVLCTPLQVANAMAAIANGGRLYKPHFFHRASRPDGTVVAQAQPEFRAVPVSAETLSVVRQGMRKVVESGTASGAGLDRFRAAGKTGTAQLGTSGRYHAWFAGYAPYEEPKIAFAVVSERTPGHGGTEAAPIMAMALEPVWDQVQAMP
jgi:penicillin-binding protein 2